MTNTSGRRARTHRTPVDPSRFVHIDRPSNASLRGAVVTGIALSFLFGAAAGGAVLLPFHPENELLYLVGMAVGVVVANIVNVRVTLRSGRRRREDFIRCGGDPTGMTDMMFGVMRGQRTEKGEWYVPEQGSGDYQGI
ncbi:hypothetical protein Achl_4475 (plasmid) [Pseudarthrobacter chlorophenolicus A6]|uniref:Transmembrane protein n=1 Tax=Pseudarthrobacter chlorophenolicus (strain ATCC 700700 / DSM 12829 / CIP 107037 / JCM 12360 / KCTC 9906 / NCIMB 13794 / A6) TaxID=452863 RepID=B8HJ29_PSECP|nr:hypothetical protein [Pseudarthrobacter chlorophenolicus]ACL42426.1 hypothetical protein Achl_4475 [Pseudarthrobacter chlorophenolicus A6]SDQ17970.1 hypothetical protein SAMN04489738_0532 [Pseudarthrobacter chlorophenolicus]